MSSSKLSPKQQAHHQRRRKQAIKRAMLEAQERHIRIETARIAKLEEQFVAEYIGEVEAWLRKS